LYRPEKDRRNQRYCSASLRCLNQENERHAMGQL
jgi:hypothetical protein